MHASVLVKLKTDVKRPQKEEKMTKNEPGTGTQEMQPNNHNNRKLQL